jgi:outer membrane protein TolC
MLTKALLLALLALSPARAVEPLSLADCYRAALKRSETFGIQEQLLAQAGELESQARAALLPTLTAGATFVTQEAPAAATAKQQNTVKITGTQSLFTGFREFALIRQRGALAAQQAANVQDAARSLFYDVADAFYATLALQADNISYGTELELGRQRLQELGTIGGWGAPAPARCSRNARTSRASRRRWRARAGS